MATNTAGTSYGADRTFRTAPAYDGALKLGDPTLTVHGGQGVRPSDLCEQEGVRAAVLDHGRCPARPDPQARDAVLHAQHQHADLVRAHRTTTVSTGVNPAAQTLLQRQLTGSWAGKSRPARAPTSSAVISAVTLVLR